MRGGHSRQVRDHGSITAVPAVIEDRRPRPILSNLHISWANVGKTPTLSLKGTQGVVASSPPRTLVK